MSELLTISPFEHGSYSYVLHAGLTDRRTCIKLADPAVCGEFITVPAYTAFIAYRRMLAIAFAAPDGWNAEDYEVFVGNRDFEIRTSSRSPSGRTIKWVRGRHEGVECSLDKCGSLNPVIASISDYGPHPVPKDAAEEQALKNMLLREAKIANKLATQILCHRIFRHIPAGQMIRVGFKDVVKYHDAPDTDKAIQAGHILSLTSIKNPEGWLSCRLRPINQASV